MNKPIPSIIHESWHPYLQPLFNDARMETLRTVHLIKKPFYPIREHIFRVFSMPIQGIKVVVLGQDPYPNGEAIGAAFAVNSTTPMPGSLQVIHGEAVREWFDEGIIEPEDIGVNEWRTLAHWRKQGVFLLNTALTVERGKANSHTEYWKFFTREVIHLISTKVKPVWLLWGSKAQQFESYIDNVEYIKNYSVPLIKTPTITDLNWVLKAPHPAAELYPDSYIKFTGCNHFYLANEILKAKGLSPIKW